MIDPKRGDRARYFGSRGAPMDGTLTDLVEQDGRLLLKMKLDAYEGHVEGWSECFRRIKRTKAREWWLACDGFDRFYTAYDSYEAAKTGRTMTPIHVSEVIPKDDKA